MSKTHHSLTPFWVFFFTELHMYFLVSTMSFRIQLLFNFFPWVIFELLSRSKACWRFCIDDIHTENASLDCWRGSGKWQGAPVLTFRVMEGSLEKIASKGVGWVGGSQVKNGRGETWQSVKSYFMFKKRYLQRDENIWPVPKVAQIVQNHQTLTVRG